MSKKRERPKKRNGKARSRTGAEADIPTVSEAAGPAGSQPVGDAASVQPSGAPAGSQPASDPTDGQPASSLPGGLSAGHAQDISSDEGHLTHLDEKGNVKMVDVSDKAITSRTAIAEGCIFMHPDTLDMIMEGKAGKGDVLATARVGGIMAAKATSSIIPMCHPLNITKASVEIEPIEPGEREDGRVGLHVVTTTKVDGKTGIEMEALTAASVACLTVYDMCKAVDRGMEIGEVRLLRKEGGRTGVWERC